MEAVIIYTYHISITTKYDLNCETIHLQGMDLKGYLVSFFYMKVSQVLVNLKRGFLLDNSAKNLRHFNRGGLGCQTGRGKNMKAALSPFSFLFLLCEITGPRQPRTKQPIWRSPNHHNGQSAYAFQVWKKSVHLFWCMKQKYCITSSCVFKISVGLIMLFIAFLALDIVFVVDFLCFL